MSNIATEKMEALSLFGISEDWGIWLQNETENKQELKKEDRCGNGESGRDSGFSSCASEKGETEESKATQNRKLRALLRIQKTKLASSTRRGGDLVFTNGQEFFFNEKARNTPKHLGAPRPDDYEPPFYHKKKDGQKKKQEEEELQEPSPIASLPEPQVPSLLSLDIPPPPPVFSHPPPPMVYYPVPPPTFFNVPPPSFYHPAPVFPQMPNSSYPMPPCLAPFPQYPPHNYYYY